MSRELQSRTKRRVGHAECKSGAENASMKSEAIIGKWKWKRRIGFESNLKISQIGGGGGRVSKISPEIDRTHQNQLIWTHKRVSWTPLCSTLLVATRRPGHCCTRLYYKNVFFRCRSSGLFWKIDMLVHTLPSGVGSWNSPVLEYSWVLQNCKVSATNSTSKYVNQHIEFSK